MLRKFRIIGLVGKKLLGILLFVNTVTFNLALGQTGNVRASLADYFAGSQMVIYTQASYLSDTSASAITYVNFCENGTYTLNYEGSYTVKGSKTGSSGNNRAIGASTLNNSGQWEILEHNQTYVLRITDAYGTINTYPIDIQKLIQGKWKQGRTTYILARQKAICN